MSTVTPIPCGVPYPFAVVELPFVPARRGLLDCPTCPLALLPVHVHDAVLLRSSSDRFRTSDFGVCLSCWTLVAMPSTASA